LRKAERLPAGIALNIASGVPRRLGDVLDRMLALSGVKASVESPTPPKPHKIPFLCGDSSKARTLLGWEPAIDFDRTLEETIGWWRAEIGKAGAAQKPD
jgi:GDP-4-dehydro-6-deoxy-D-mannose reductase